MLTKSLLCLFAFLFLSSPIVRADPDADLRDAYGLDSNNFYQDEEDEYIVEEGTQDEESLSAQALNAFDFVVEEDEQPAAAEDESGQAYFLHANFLDSYFLFPDAVESKEILLGEENELLVALTNKHPKNVNITAIRLSIMHPMEPTHYYLQNCSVETYFQIVKPQATQTFAYTFVPDAMLQPRDYVVVANVYFEVPEENQRYVYQAVNFTHQFDDAPTKFDTQILFIILSSVSVFGFFGYMVVSYFSGGKSRRPAPHVAAAAAPTEVKEEWISHLQKPKKKNSPPKQ